MLTKNEVETLNLSPTNKDFVQIWNELLEVAGKLSERWDPTSTNESDPGIVILKALTGIADRLNYNIDKNILEAFMPTAAQTESMRKLCDMLGYAMKYYRSATTTVALKYHASQASEDEKNIMESADGLTIPKFTVITNADKDINYFTTESKVIYNDTVVHDVHCMEGQIVKCETINGNNVITQNQISELNRFYLPETQIAENGIFIYNVINNEILNDLGFTDGEKWELVDNLNVQPRNSKVFKFGFDSYDSRPYVEFPDDYSELFEDGIALYYTRTHGANGNISARTLSQLDLPSTGDWSKVDKAHFSVENAYAVTNGADAETIKQAYNNFKKTVGTFNVLVTCRDYMNYLYNATNSMNKPYVSNVLVTDIRDDINRAFVLCSCDDSGIYYKEIPAVGYKDANSSNNITHANRPVFNAVTKTWHLGTNSGMKLTKETMMPTLVDSAFDDTKDADAISETTDHFWQIKQGKTWFKTVLPSRIVEDSTAIDHFDLVLYPFKSYNQIKSGSGTISVKDAYDSSFTYSETAFNDLKTKILSDKVSTLAHNFIKPRVRTTNFPGDVLCINNYLKLNATIATTSKITAEECEILIDRVKIALANAFNMRELDFGEEIPFESILSVIETADARIKSVALNDPVLYTTFSVLDSYANGNTNGYAAGMPIIKEYAVASEWLDAEQASKSNSLKDTFDTTDARKIYNKLAVRNILAGRVPLFKYDNTFKSNFNESSCINSTEVTLADIESNDVRTILTEKSPSILASGADIYLYDGTEKIVKKTLSKVTVGKDDDKVELPLGMLSVVDNKNNKIKGIETSCKIYSKEDENSTAGIINDIKLERGEFIRFRAPNFITEKTYPAYVNYNLNLANDTLSEARFAKATSLFDILDSDRKYYSKNKTDIKWQRAIDYFNATDRINNTSHKKSAKLSKRILVSDASTETDNGKFVLSVDNVEADSDEYSVAALLATSGCIKLVSTTANIKWIPQTGETAPQKPVSINGVPLEIRLEMQNPFIVNIDVFTAIQTQVDELLEANKEQLPTECSWEISFDLECVPFSSASLSAWEAYMRNCTAAEASIERYQLLDFSPVFENNTVFWRTFGDGYAPGKYITEDTSKLLKFSSNYFGNLPENRLRGVYIAGDLGADTKPYQVANDAEYQLGANEYLYIEYTPSTTAEDGTTSAAAEPVREVYGQGTIIKPSGFEGNGLVDSTMLSRTEVKRVAFENHGEMPMYSLGANEKIEIRDFARTVFEYEDKSFILNMYKNFDCPILESIASGSNDTRTYVLKDGEFIYYTDKNKAELAFFTSGTEVTFRGVYLKRAEIIDNVDILENGPDAVPWQEISFSSSGKSVTFQEYQYRTLGEGDTLKSLKLVAMTEDDTGNPRNYISNEWQYCDEVEYIAAIDAGADNPTSQKLPPIRLPDRAGNGWEVCSILELNASPFAEQTLRKSPNVETSITLTGIDEGGDGVTSSLVLSPELLNEEYADISFKTDLVCHSSSSLAIDDVTNPDKKEGFSLKVFSKHVPEIVETKSDELVPYNTNSYFSAWPYWTEDSLVTLKTSSDLWDKVDLSSIAKAADRDKALRLPLSLSPNTYGVFCVYLKMDAEELYDRSVWIEAIPGTSVEDISCINRPEAAFSTDKHGRLHRLYLSPGINCIRVNKTWPIFIKASEDASGTLLFDDLRLVKTGITTENGEILSDILGLNLEQIGYFAIDDVNDRVAGYIDKTIDDLAREAALKEKDVDIVANNLIADSEKLEELVSIEHEILLGLKRILAITDEDDRNVILEELRNISTRLALKHDLLELLDSSDDIADIADIAYELTELVNLLSSDYDKVITSIADRLNTAETKSISAIEGLTKQDYLKAFCYDVESMRATKEEFETVRRSLIEKLTKDYYAKLAEILTNLENVAYVGDSAKLLEAVKNIRSIITADTREKALSLVNRLIELTSDNKLITACTALRAASDLESVLECATTLRELLTNDAEIWETFSELAEILKASDKDFLLADIRKRFEEHKKYKGSLEYAENYDSLVSLIVNVRNELKNPNTMYNYDTHVNDIVSYFLKKNKDTVDACTKELLALLNELAGDTDNSTEISVVQQVISDLQSAASSMDAERARVISGWIEALKIDTDEYVFMLNVILSEFTYDAVKLARDNPYNMLLQAVLPAIWLNKIKKTVSAEYEVLRQSVVSGGNNLPLSVLILPERLGDTIASLFDTELMSTLDEEITAASNAAMAAGHHNKLLGTVNKLTSLPNDLTKKLETLANSSTDTPGFAKDTQVVYTAKRILAASTLTEKQHFIAILKKELEKVKADDERIYGLISKVILPFDKLRQPELYDRISKDPFYEKLYTFINDNFIKSVTTDYDGLFKDLDSYYEHDNTLFLASKSTKQQIFDYLLEYESDQPDSLYKYSHDDMCISRIKLGCINTISALLKKLKEMQPDTFDAKALQELQDICDKYPKQYNDKSWDPYREDITKYDDWLKKQINYLTNNINNAASESDSDLAAYIAERQLIRELQELDRSREFYYNVPVETSVAIDFNEQDRKFNTLLNPIFNYDINNVNNNFVISKLDIDYLDSGIKVARSSRLS